MNKSWKTAGLAFMLAFLCMNVPVSAAVKPYGAKPVQYDLSVDESESVPIWAYEIEGDTYFKLRDMAAALNGTSKQFGLAWDGDGHAVTITAGEGYAPDGGELSEPDHGMETAYLPETDFFIGERRIPMRSYIINDVHYAELLDLAANIMFAAELDGGKLSLTTSAYDTGIYSLSLPEGWSAAGSAYSLDFERSGDAAGSFIMLNYDPDTPISQFQGNHAETLSSEELTDFAYPAAKAVIRRTKPAAAQDDSYVDELHIYVMLPELRCAFDFSFDAAKVDEPTALLVAKGLLPKDAAIERNSLAAQWARAIQERDGHAQYALLSSKLQPRFYDFYEAAHWVTGVSSPWVNSFKVEIAGDRAVVFYEGMTSTGFAGYTIDVLSFEEENGALKISGIDGYHNFAEYNT